MNVKDMKIESGQGAISSETVENYLATMTNKNPETLRRERKTLTEFIPFLNGQTPQTALDAFQKSLEEQGSNRETAQRYRNRAEKFCRWTEQGKTTSPEAEYATTSEGTTASDNTKAQHNDTEGNADTEGANNMGTEQTTRRKAGRPKRTDGLENRSQKFSLYLPPSLYTSLDELSRFQGRSITDIIVVLAEAYVKDNGAELEIFRRARQEAAKLHGQD